MMKLTARYADTWNTMSFAQSFDEQLAETRQRAAAMDENCAAIDRDPQTLRRSFNVFDPASRASGGHLQYLESEQRFRDTVEPFLQLGMTEIGVYWPMLDNQRDAFESIAREVMPALRTEYGAPG